MSKTTPKTSIVKFQPFSSTVEPSFWLSLSKLKLHVIKLNQDFITVSSSFGISPPQIRKGTASTSTAATTTTTTTSAVRVRLDQASLPAQDANIAQNEQKEVQQECIKNELIHISNGQVMLLNTKESFKTLDKNAFLNENGIPPLLKCCGITSNEKTYTNIEEEEEEDLSSLQSFLLLTYMNLKDHSIVYWFAFPALAPQPGKSISYSNDEDNNNGGQFLLCNVWSESMLKTLHLEYHKMRIEHLQKAIAGETKVKYTGCIPYFLIVPISEENVHCQVLSYKSYTNLSEDEKNKVMFGFLDPAPSASSSSLGTQQQQQQQPVGWTLRNFIAYLSIKLGLGGQHVKIVSYRPKMLRRIPLDSLGDENNAAAKNDHDEIVQDGDSLLLNIVLPHADDYQWPAPSSSSSTSSPIYKCVGWELNARQKPGPRSLNLTPLLSPTHLAVQAMDLNLRLMKWRMIPSLNLDKLSSLNVLLLGAGTLGCAVARTLLGWGIKNITLVDNGKVSYSNPVRQSLFNLSDCENGGKPKAMAAAAALKEIAGPNVNSSAVKLTIPMPGHDFTSTPEEEASVKSDIAQMEELVKRSDVVFLLTDTRESRWLPCVLARSYSKILINAALGFDSWLVMRHGLSSAKTSNVRLGCYFCNDVVAPENSMKDRTLDQQCTVTRPGLANIAASMAVELMVSLIHHEDGADAPAPAAAMSGAGVGGRSAATYAPGVVEEDKSSSPLGVMPHQIRGSLTSYTLMTPTVPAYHYCTACSDAIVQAYDKDGFEFIKKACCSDSSFLEDVSGWTAFREEAMVKMEECLDDWDSEEDDDDEEEENDILLDG